MKRKSKIVIFIVCLIFGLISYQTIKHKTEITKFLVKTILEHQKENAFEFVNKFVSVVPNYANKDGFEIVSKEDYEKYQQGYCLAENRILDKKELYERAVGEYLDKELEINKKIDTWRFQNYGKSWKSIIPISYYKLETTNLERANNEYLKAVEKASEIRRYDDRKELLAGKYMEIFKPISINPKISLKINLEDMVAGFPNPIVFNGFYGRTTYHNNSFLLCYDGVSHNRQANKNINEKKERHNIKNTCKARYKMDNCGNINYDIEKEYLRSREAKGG